MHKWQSTRPRYLGGGTPQSEIEVNGNSEEGNKKELLILHHASISEIILVIKDWIFLPRGSKYSFL